MKLYIPIINLQAFQLAANNSNFICCRIDKLCRSEYDCRNYIAKYAIVLDIADKSSEYKEDLVSLSYAVNSGYALQGTDTNTALGVTLSTAATNTSNVGTYKISGTYTSTNYSVTFAGLYDGDTTSGRYTMNTSKYYCGH